MPAPLPPALSLTPPKAPLIGKVTLPGSKSITNRALPLAALSQGVSTITGALKSEDTAHMANALRAMGVGVEEPDATSFIVHGTGTLKAPESPLYLGNAGTAMRFLTALCATVTGTVTLTGDASMQKRPIAPLVTALQTLGVAVRAPSGCPPVTLTGTGHVNGGVVEIDAGLSSQYVSAMLMLAPLAVAPLTLRLKSRDAGATIGARGYVDLTLAVMRAFGATVEQKGDAEWDIASSPYRSADFAVEPDASAATYLWAAEKLTGGTIDLGLAPHAFTQPDAKAHALIAQFPHMPATIDGAQMQDAVPTLAVLAAFNSAAVRFTGIANLRVKECDRIRALSTELSRIAPALGVEEGDDLIINPHLMPTQLDAPVMIETYHDHRIAMAFALAGLKRSNIIITNPACVGKTFPDYFATLERLGCILIPA